MSARPTAPVGTGPDARPDGRKFVPALVPSDENRQAEEAERGNPGSGLGIPDRGTKIKYAHYIL